MYLLFLFKSWSQDSVKRWCWFFGIWVGIHRNSKLVKLFQVIWQSGSWVLVPKLSLQIRLFDSFTEWLDLLISFLTWQLSITSDTNWISFCHWWVLGFFAGFAWSPACFHLISLLTKRQSCHHIETSQLICRANLARQKFNLIKV